MASRPSVKQAIELLKIHQLRRENVAIYEEIQALRGELSDVRTDNNEIDKRLTEGDEDVNQRLNSISARVAQVENLKTAIESCNSRDKDLACRISSLESNCNQWSKETKEHNVGFHDRIEQLKDKCKEQNTANKSAHLLLQQQVERLELQEKSSTILDRLREIENDLSCLRMDVRGLMKRSQHIEERSTSRIHDSIEQGAENINHGTENTENRQQDETNVTAWSEFFGNASQSAQPRNGRMPLTDPDDLDLDDIGFRLNDSDQVLPSCRSSQSQDLYPMNWITENSIIGQLLDFQQQTGESLQDYLDRGYRMIPQLKNEAENIIIHCLVEHLLNQKHRKTFSEWVRLTAWTKENLDDVAALYGVQRMKIPGSATVVDLSPQKLQNNDKEYKSLMTRTNDTRIGAQIPNKPDILQKKEQVVKPHPRRSQRLAERLRPDERSNHLNSTRRSRDSEIHSEVSHQDMSRSSVQLPIQQEHSIKAAASVRYHKSNNKHPTVDSYQSRVRKTDRKSRGTVRDPGLMNSPRTPTKTGPCESTRNRPVIAMNVPCTPISKARENVSGLRPRHKRQRSDNHLPSPYDPKPQLVLKSCKEAGSVTRSELVSTPIVQCTIENHQSDIGVPKVICEKSNGRPVKRKRIPLPPPPEIPILSTSTEEDRRFDKW